MSENNEEIIMIGVCLKVVWIVKGFIIDDL